MNKSLNERFAETAGGPILLEGKTVHVYYKRNIRAGDSIRLEFLSWSEERSQGINLRTREGLLRVNDAESSAISLWLETAPPIVEVLCVESPRDGLLSVSNQWRHKDGVEDEWTNNAGVLVEERDDGAVLRFSDGVGEPTFNDLIVELSVTSLDGGGSGC